MRLTLTNRCKYLSDLDLKAVKAAFSELGIRSVIADQFIALSAFRDISLSKFFRLTYHNF